MRQIPAQQLLDCWEAFRDQPRPLRAVALVALLMGQPLQEVLSWSVVRRDVGLFDLQAQVFGNNIEAVTHCPQCAEKLEMQLDLAQIKPKASALKKNNTRTLKVNGHSVRYRAPTSEDLLAIASLHDVGEARAQLLARCIQTTQPELRELAAARVAARIADEQADVQLNLTCPACGHGWQSIFDIASFVWHELDAWAQRTLREVHLIASAYGWGEDEILQLSARRRQTYIEMIR